MLGRFILRLVSAQLKKLSLPICPVWIAPAVSPAKNPVSLNITEVCFALRLLLAAAKEEAAAMEDAVTRVWRLEAELSRASTETELLLLSPRAEVAVVSRNFPSKDLASAVFRIRQANPALRVVLLAGQRDDEGQRLIDAAIACGVYDIILVNDQGEVDGEEIRRAITGESGRRYEDVAHLHTQVALPEPPAPEPSPDTIKIPVPPIPQIKLSGAGLVSMLARAEPGPAPGSLKPGAPAPPRGVVLAVFGASGGAGRTTAAANLAAALAVSGFRVSALDLSVHSPALADHLGLRSYAPGRWQALLRGEAPAVVLVPGGVEGVRVLPGPALDEAGALVTAGAEAVRRLIGQMRLEDDFIVLDTPAAPLDALVQAAFEEAGVAVFVTDASMSAAKRLAAALNGPWGAGRALKVLVVTRAHPEIGRDGEAAARELAVRPNLVVADNPSLYWPSAAGSPVALSNSPDGNAWRKLAAGIAAKTGKE